MFPCEFGGSDRKSQRAYMAHPQWAEQVSVFT